MKKETLIHDWAVEVPEGFSLMSNETGEVAIVCLSKRFGDMQPLLLKLEADHVEVLAIPHIINKVKITVAKQVTLELADFFEDM